jgi:hypothetical protein
MSVFILTRNIGRLAGGLPRGFMICGLDGGFSPIMRVTRKLKKTFGRGGGCSLDKVDSVS